MRQRVFPCCKEPMTADDIFYAMEDSSNITEVSSRTITCPNCSKELIVYLNIDNVELSE